ncbi:hypothetical protein OKA04_12210 [Luteolibacter flavescens]|uniref:Uncharacterized protein n=1 Tax=Luteolibacter flavescens TaxID=1859460 RepID=A0ABT3FQA0_9BACT|nr:hypothetical protein [Luteolibacter flavescens]MCW1885494.1 hypothetical protein [Luteolibacter flavescens]
MKPPSSLAAFERGLKEDHAQEEARKLEVLGIELEKPKKRSATRMKASARDQKCLRTNIGIQPELGDQLERVAHALELSPLDVGRMILAAGIEAVVCQIEATGNVVLPLRLEVRRQSSTNGTRYLRTVTPERFESLRGLFARPLARWCRGKHAGDRTGELMPPPPPEPTATNTGIGNATIIAWNP